MIANFVELVLDPIHSGEGKILDLFSYPHFTRFQDFRTACNFRNFFPRNRFLRNCRENAITQAFYKITNNVDFRGINEAVFVSIHPTEPLCTTCLRFGKASIAILVCSLHVVIEAFHGGGVLLFRVGFTRLHFDANRLTIFGKGHIPVAIGIKLRTGRSIWKFTRCHHFIAVLIIAMKNGFLESILGRYGRKQENGE